MATETARPGAAPDGMRIDKWLWHARFFKTRAQASRVCADGRVRVDGVPIAKAHYLVRAGNVLTFPQARDIRVVRVLALGARRGPPREAQALYSDLAPVPRSSPLPGGAGATKTVGSQQEKY
jgi:ribosome-associated heat shock protein Hsp15